MADDVSGVTSMAAAAGGIGGAARVLVAIQGGSRGWALALDFGLGVVLGIMAAGGLLLWDPSLRSNGWPVLIVAGAAGCAGAIGTRALDLLTIWLQKRLGV